MRGVTGVGVLTINARRIQTGREGGVSALAVMSDAHDTAMSQMYCSRAAVEQAIHLYSLAHREVAVGVSAATESARGDSVFPCFRAAPEKNGRQQVRHARGRPFQQGGQILCSALNKVRNQRVEL